MQTLFDAKNPTTPYLTITYDAKSRVSQQQMADGSLWQIAYTEDSAGRIAQANVTDPRGIVRRVIFNGNRQVISHTTACRSAPPATDPCNLTIAETATYTRQTGSNLVTAIQDPLLRQTTFQYDTQGHLLSRTNLANSGTPITSSYTTDPALSRVSGVTDTLSRTAAFTYDAQGNLTVVSGPLGHTTQFDYLPSGQPYRITDALSQPSQLGYDHGLLVTAADPLGQTSRRFADSMGRTLQTTNAMGQTTRRQYDALGRVTQVTDPAGNATSFSYDANSNLHIVTDALTHATTYDYDSLDRLSTRHDPLGQLESYDYWPGGLLRSHTDRLGQQTTYDYDELGRLHAATFGPGDTLTYTYDAGDRLTRIHDSLATGPIQRTYDDLNHLQQETTPQGSVSYVPAPLGRRTSMAVAGQPQVSYYDARGRLQSISQGTTSVGFGYDILDRRTSLTLPNGIQLSYGYDADSRLTSVTYQQGTTTLGDLSYSYDAIGQHLTMGGSYARTGLPAPMSGALYDANNRLTQWNGVPLPAGAWDANGNLLNDGTRQYTWNRRHQLTSIAGPTSASFLYDAFGRRVQKTIGGTTTGFLYDGLNPVAELAGTTPTATLLTGLNSDEYFQRTEGGTTRTFLPGALGSTLALTDSTGTLQTQYTYDPFGNSTSSGAASTNPYQYTGRENDGTGLQYSRARYYSSGSSARTRWVSAATSTSTPMAATTRSASAIRSAWRRTPGPRPRSSRAT